MRLSRIKKYKQKQKEMGFNFTTDQDITTPAVVEETLTQEIFTEGEEAKMAIQFLEDSGLYQKFLLYCGIQEQLKKLYKDLENTPDLTKANYGLGKGLLD
jgi:hypothetical protein